MKKRHRSSYYVAALISLATIAVYSSGLRNDFVNWDDDRYVYDNHHIRALDWSFLKWAFTDVSVSYWHPVPWISHALDYALWGLNPIGHHLTSILLHGANTFFVVVLIMTVLEASNARSREAGHAPLLDERSILVAAGVTGTLFGLHPLHVESVAWVTERKDLLCALFFLASLMSYVTYVADLKKRPAHREVKTFAVNRYYVFTMAFFVIALSSKPMAVTLPLVLLLLDWYPLGRVRSVRSLVAACAEKMPFLAMSLIMSIVAFLSQRSLGAVISLDAMPMAARVAVACKAVVVYLGKMALPLRLLPVYPDPEGLSLFSLENLLAATCVCVITAASIGIARKHKLVPAVWAYYLITLLPVLGIVKVGAVSMADRFTYLPSIGPFLLIGVAAAAAWRSLPSLDAQGLIVRRVILGVVIMSTVPLSSVTIKQISIWKNSITLWSYVIEKEPSRAPLAYNNRGLAYKEMGLVDPALKDFDKAITLDPGSANAHLSRAWTFKDLGLLDRALEDYDHAVALGTGRSGHGDMAFNNRGVLFLERGQLDRAIDDFTAAVNLNPGFARAYMNRGLAYERVGSIDRALEDYTSAIEADPSYANAYVNRGLIFEQTRLFDRAIDDLSTAIRLDPGSVEARNNRALAYEDLGRFDEALADYDRALAVRPDDALTYGNRGIVLRKMGRPENAIEDLTKALSLNPGFAQAYADRGDCYGDMGKAALALRDYQEACRRGSGPGCEAMRREKQGSH